MRGKHFSGRFLVSLLTKSQASRAKGKARARAGAAAGAGARRQARRAAAQARPLTASARTAARQGIHHARSWAAPRLDRTGHSLEERVAPKVAAMLSAAARRIEPVPPRRRRRWPVLAAGLVTAAGLSATAAYLLKRRARTNAPEFTAPADAHSTTMPTEAPSHLAASDANGRVRTG
jgi:hypothetical protein